MLAEWTGEILSRSLSHSCVMPLAMMYKHTPAKHMPSESCLLYMVHFLCQIPGGCTGPCRLDNVIVLKRGCKNLGYLGIAEHLEAITTDVVLAMDKTLSP